MPSRRKQERGCQVEGAGAAKPQHWCLPLPQLFAASPELRYEVPGLDSLFAGLLLGKRPNEGDHEFLSTRSLHDTHNPNHDHPNA